MAGGRYMVSNQGDLGWNYRGQDPFSVHQEKLYRMIREFISLSQKGAVLHHETFSHVLNHCVAAVLLTVATTPKASRHDQRVQCSEDTL